MTRKKSFRQLIKENLEHKGDLSYFTVRLGYVDNVKVYRVKYCYEGGDLRKLELTGDQIRTIFKL